MVLKNFMLVGINRSNLLLTKWRICLCSNLVAQIKNDSNMLKILFYYYKYCYQQYSYKYFYQHYHYNFFKFEKIF